MAAFRETFGGRSGGRALHVEEIECAKTLRGAEHRNLAF